MHRPRDLTKQERAGATLIGLSGTIVGGFGIFLSDNQAGTAVILILGVVFLLMAVQGTAVRRITKEGGDFAERAAAEKRVYKSIELTREEDGPEAGQAALQAAIAARPDLSDSPVLSAVNDQLYVELIIFRIQYVWRARYGTSLMINRLIFDDANYDAVIRRSDSSAPDRTVTLTVLHTTTSQVRPKRVLNLIERSRDAIVPNIVVANAEYPDSLRDADGFQPEAINNSTIALVTWRGSQDDKALLRALQNMLKPDETDPAEP